MIDGSTIVTPLRAASASSSRARSTLSSSTREWPIAMPCALQERVGHRAADQDRVDFVQQVSDDADFVGNFGAAQNRDVRTLRIFGDCAQRLELAHHQETRRALAQESA